jgi:hypothetical protein
VIAQGRTEEELEKRVGTALMNAGRDCQARRLRTQRNDAKFFNDLDDTACGLDRREQD